MEKPIVFLSHSSKDKTQLVALKALLDKRAVGSLEFFLSSDGQSIRFGRNWVVRVSDALAQAKLMFVFLSPHSADSKWMHFEAGCAYANNIEVVPVCLPGLELNRINPPLSLLQGFNLHSHEAMGNIARICNETFSLRMEETFLPEDFGMAFADSVVQQKGFFGDSSWAVERVVLTCEPGIISTEAFEPSLTFEDICKTGGADFLAYDGKHQDQRAYKQFELHGCVVSVTEEVGSPKSNPPAATRPEAANKRARIYCTLSPELFHINAPLLDQWRTKMPSLKAWSASIHFQPNVVAEQTRFKLTTRLYNSDIRLIDKTTFDFNGLVFRLNQSIGWVSQGYGLQNWKLDFQCSGQLRDDRLAQLINTLFETQVLFVSPPLEGGER